MTQSAVARNAQWFRDTGQLPATPAPDVRQSAFYTGMQCEELAEKLAAIVGEGASIVADLAALGNHFKQGELDKHVEVALSDPVSAEAMLDGDVDLMFVSVGAGAAQGANVEAAYDTVTTANEAKRFPDGTYHRAKGTGKVLKPEGWQAPNLKAFLHPAILNRAPMQGNSE